MSKIIGNLARDLNESKIYFASICVYITYTFTVVLFSFNIQGIGGFISNKSYSMSPVINPGSVLFILKMDSYDEGNIITYYSRVLQPSELITHRIVSVGGNVYITKGDNNITFDDTRVLPRQIIGKTFFIIPYVGYLVNYAKSSLGLWITIYIPAFLIVLSETIKIIALIHYRKSKIYNK